MTIIYIILGVLFVLCVYKFAYLQGYRDRNDYLEWVEREFENENTTNN